MCRESDIDLFYRPPPRGEPRTLRIDPGTAFDGVDSELEIYARSIQTEIGDLVELYLLAHPNHRHPVRELRHPAVYAVHSDIQAWIMAQLGVRGFWWAMVRGARVWFRDGQPEKVRRAFCYFYEATACSCRLGVPGWEDLDGAYAVWRATQPAFAEVTP